MASLRLTSRNWTWMVTWARGEVRSSNIRRAGKTLETRSRRITLLFWVSKAAFSMAKACCTAVTMALKSCGLVASGRCSSMAATGSRSVRTGGFWEVQFNGGDRFAFGAFLGSVLDHQKDTLGERNQEAAGGGFQAVQGIAVVRVRHRQLP